MKKVQKLKVIKEHIAKQKSTGMVNAVMTAVVPELKPVQTFALSYLLHGKDSKTAIEAMGWVLQEEAKKEDVKELIEKAMPIAEGFYTSDSMIALFFQLKDSHLPTIAEVVQDPKGLTLFKGILLSITTGYEYIS